MNQHLSRTEPERHVDVEIGHVIRMRGLPWNATVQDITNFFSECKIVGNGVLIVTNAENRVTGLDVLLVTCLH